MIFHFHQIIVCVVLSALALSSLAQNISSTHCVKSCGKDHVPYPFGFSDGCRIKLNCNNTSGTIEIGDFRVQNVTADGILINFPARCDRPVAELSRLLSRHVVPTSRNGFLFKNCSSPLKDCVIPNTLARSKFEFEGCDSGASNDGPYNISCYSQGLDGMELFNYSKVINQGNCSVLFSSIMVDLNDTSSSVSGSSSILLKFQTMELNGWMDGKCSCDANATCRQVLYKERQGFSCKCNDGYIGDGFVKGEGCRKVFDYSASRCMPVRRRGTRVEIFIGGVIAGAFMVIILAFICHHIKRRSNWLKNRLSTRHLLSEAVGNSNVPFYTYREIERATAGFAEKQRLGIGAYGTVFAGKLHNDELVAIKKIRYRDHDSVEQVMNEIKLLSSVSHPNLVRLLGCCIENGEQILVYEYMPNGTLSQHLQRERGTVLPWTTRLTIAAETARAIAHLHSAINPPIYHRDVKSSNILLDCNFNSKVADFGLSRIGMMEDSHISTAPQGTPGYVDPQYHQNFHLSDKSDVYSFGVVLVEIITAMKVVDFSRQHSEINLAALALERIGKGHVDDIVDPFLEPNRDAWTLSSVHKVAELAFRCLAFHRDMRPSMMEVADELEQIRLSGWAPLEENIYMESSVASSCSSPYLGSEKSLNTSKPTIVGIESWRLMVMQRTVDALPRAEEATDSSPVSVQDPWFREQSSPSSNSLLSKVVG